MADPSVKNIYSHTLFQIFPGNKDVSTVVRNDLDPAFMARYIRVHPGYNTGANTCMRLELYGCVAEEGILSYSMPVGQTTKNGKVLYKDTSYNGVITNGFYKHGTGILTDGKFGPADSKKHIGNGWVGWNATQSQYIDITFEFSGMRKFKDVILTVKVDKKRDNAVFSRSHIFLSSTEDNFSDTSLFLQYCPRDFQAKDDSYNANVTLSLCENTARFMKLRLYFGGKWLLISEISFNSGILAR
ncbi:Hypothetical predicted protein [Paramuricea clavata]|uniref:Uncharacterized protein n=1 Tax=Paramuricea clavata TaxID=317549 RepID=A0A7D9MCC3_PARCT|nr:Hypothetical predicted protein [Paramuricea clavata]